MKIKAKLLLVFLTLILLSSCSKTEQKRSSTFYTYFDTVCTITSYDKETKEHFDSVCKSVEELLDSLNRNLDIYHSYYGINNLFDLNENAGSFVRLSEDTVEFLKYCLEAKKFTKGYTNIEMGSVLSLWHKARTETGVVPSSVELEEASKHCEDILEFDGWNVRLNDCLARIDTGAIAKGWVADRVGDLLLELGCKSYVVDIGGNIKCLGSKKDGKPYTVGIKNPSLNSSLKARLSLTDKSCVTSGDYERYFEVDGKRYCHIIDPNTLSPAENFSSVSVVCENSAKADAMSTALFCMSFEEGYRLVESLNDVEAFWIFKDGRTESSTGLPLV